MSHHCLKKSVPGWRAGGESHALCDAGEMQVISEERTRVWGRLIILARAFQYKFDGVPSHIERFDAEYRAGCFTAVSNKTEGATLRHGCCCRRGSKPETSLEVRSRRPTLRPMDELT